MEFLSDGPFLPMSASHVQTAFAIAPRAAFAGSRASLDGRERGDESAHRLSRFRGGDAVPPKAATQSHVSGSACLVAAWATVLAPTALSAKSTVSTGRRAKMNRPRRTMMVAVNAGQEKLAEREAAVVDDDAEALEMEVARLRAEVAQLEDEKEQAREEERARLFGIFDVDKSGAIDLDELQRGLKQFWGIDVDEDMAMRLIKTHDDNRDGVLQQEEFDLQRLESTYGKLKAEDREKQQAIVLEERRRKEEEEKKNEYVASLPLANEDTGIVARVGSVLAYILPLLDALRYKSCILAFVPQLQPILAGLTEVLRLLNVIPLGFGPLLLFIAMQAVANDTRLPMLLRFNSRQAVVLTVLMFFPGILGSLADIFARGLLGTEDEWGQWQEGMLPLAISQPCGSLVFVAVVACIIYSVGSSLLGVAPTGVPYLSREAVRTMAPTRDGSQDDTSSK